MVSLSCDITCLILCRSLLTSLVTALLLLSVVLYLGPFFQPLPICVLSAIIMVSLSCDIYLPDIVQVAADQPGIRAAAAVCSPLPGTLLPAPPLLCTLGHHHGLTQL
jgi:hypothetical protein